MTVGPAAARRGLSVLLVHGAGGGAWEWNLWRAVMEAHSLAVHAIDLEHARGTPASTSLKDYMGQVRAALQRLPRPRVLVGASLGGLLCAACADEADALVLINPLPPVPWQQAMKRRDWADVVRWQGDARLASTLAAMPDADQASALFAFRNWRDEAGNVLAAAQAGIEVAKPSCPTLFVISSRDDEVQPEVVCAWADAWQAERLDTIAASHVGPLLGSRANRIACETVAWVNRLDRVH